MVASKNKYTGDSPLFLRKASLWNIVSGQAIAAECTL